MLSSALKVLGERPDIQALLRSERDRIPNFIEETLRIESPVKGDFRLSRLPTTVGGVDIPAGTTVMVMNGAANRDPRQFEQPDEFDVARPNAHRHIAFGRGILLPRRAAGAGRGPGLHRTTLDRTTDIRISEDKHGPADARRYSFVPTYILRGLTELHLDFDVAEETAR